MSGKLIIIESGVDGSGKATQTEMLYKRLLEDGEKVKRITFPNYKSDSSAIVKMYLNGDFGKRPDDVNPYITSTFFSIDRYASFKKEWEKYYEEDYIIISDRYTSSNMIHQSAKMTDIEEVDKYIEWLENYEYNFYKIPRPDYVVFLDVDPKTSFKLIESRKNEIDGSDKKDIHESDKNYLERSYKISKYISEKYNWNIIKCVDENGMKSIEEISDTIYTSVRDFLNYK